MKRQEKIDSDIAVLLNSLHGLDKNSQKELIKNLISKHIILTESDLVIDYRDTINILSRAASIYSTMPIPVEITGRRLDSTQLSGYAIMNGTIEFLNNNGAIKRLPIFK